MARLKESDISQGQFIAVNLGEQLLPGTFEWTLNYLIDRTDMSMFEQKYNNDEKGAAAYPPKALLKIILYCYSTGILTSRPMEKACRNNMIIKALAEDFEPDHDTIAAFISTNNEAVNGLFVQILMQCDELDLITGEMFGLDGCKLPSNASKEWSGTIENLKKKKARYEKFIKKITKRHRDLDKSGDAKRKQGKYKKTMGDDKGRRERHIERIEKKLERLKKFLDEAEPKKGPSGQEVQTNITDPQSAKIKGPHGYIQGYNGITLADSKSQVIICAKAAGSAESGNFSEMLESLENNMKAINGKEKPLKKKALCLADTGFFSEDNLQEAAKRKIEVIIPDPQFRQRDSDFDIRKEENKKTQKRYSVEDFIYNKRKNAYTCPNCKELKYKGKMTLRNNEGYKYQASSSDCVQCPLMEKCITLKHRKAKKSIKHARSLYIIERKYAENLSEKMKKKIDDPAYRELYSRRQQIIEPVFANITYCKGMDRFTLRGEEKVNAQWLLYSIVHNIGKCIRPIEEKIRKKHNKKAVLRLINAA